METGELVEAVTPDKWYSEAQLWAWLDRQPVRMGRCGRLLREFRRLRRNYCVIFGFDVTRSSSVYR